MERGGTDEFIGTPVAFIETAWRRYTKHSKAKAQEIEGAVLPLATTHEESAPFIGAILAGIFTDTALEQLRSQRFCILHFPYETVMEAFQSVEMDVTFDEDTSEEELDSKVRAWESLPDTQRKRVARALVQIDSKEVQQFMRGLEAVIIRQVEFVRVIPLHGSEAKWYSVEEAINFIETYDENADPKPFVKYEVEVRYKNGDRIEGLLTNKESAVRFLRAYVPAEPPEL